MNWAEKLQGDKQTNNRAELSAAIIGISQAIRLELQSVRIITVSRYVKDGIANWINEWKLNGWKTAGKAAKNKRPQEKCPPTCEMSLCGEYVYNMLKKCHQRDGEFPPPSQSPSPDQTRHGPF